MMCHTGLTQDSHVGFDRERICEALAYARRPGLRNADPCTWSVACAVLHKALVPLSVYGEAYLDALPDEAPERPEVRRLLVVTRDLACRGAVPRQILVAAVERLVSLADAVRTVDDRGVHAGGLLSGRGSETAVPGTATDP